MHANQICAALTMQPAELTTDDQLLIEPLRSHGVELIPVSWKDSEVEWSSFRAVVIRSTWDYQRDPEEFVTVLSRINESGAVLLNPFDLVCWNLNKRYLSNLADGGVSIVPTCWLALNNPTQLEQVLNEIDADEFVVKPLVSASAENTFRIGIEDLRRASEESENDSPLPAVLWNAPEVMLQPFLQSILGEGEYSLFYFAGQLSHAINKRPKRGDFRVQEEHGGRSISVEAPIGAQELAEHALSKLSSVPLYARVDIVPEQDTDGFMLMELELIEPALYLEFDDQAPIRLANAFMRQLESRASL